MANSITLFKKYIDLLDEVYQNASVTSALDGDMTLVQMGANTNEIVIPKISMDGLADYDRNGGYVHGDVTLTNETVKFNYDRGENLRSMPWTTRKPQGLRLGSWRRNSSAQKWYPKWMPSALRPTQAQQAFPRQPQAHWRMVRRFWRLWWRRRTKMDEDEVPQENRHLFITPTHHNRLMRSIPQNPKRC